MESKIINVQTVPELCLNNVAMMFINSDEVIVSRRNSAEFSENFEVNSNSSLKKRVSRRLGKYGLLRSRSTGPNGKRYDSPLPVSRHRRASSMSPAPSSSPESSPRPWLNTRHHKGNMPFNRPSAPAPLLIEDPPSSENVSDLEDLKQQIDPALLNGSSGNFGSAGARSAPSTPQGILSSLPGSISDSQSVYSYTCSIPRSPSHNIFNKNDKGSIKQLSTSAPIMTAQAQINEPPSPKAPAKEKHPTASKARQKKFCRHFPQATGETVLNYYSCALISDILLQGHLYITRNYFAFYSNVFGYVTKLLIPMASVRKISKEKTARIIPNAVGITTIEDKHVFGSLMSRDSTYKYMNEVWDAAKELAECCDEATEPSMVGPSDLSDSSETREESGRESTSDMATRFRTCVKPPEIFSNSFTNVDGNQDKVKESGTKFKESYFKLTAAPKQSVLLFVTTFMLILLFLSAAILLYRIGRVQTKYTQALQDNFVLSESEDVYGELLQWQTHLHSKSAGAVHSFLDSNLDQIAKVRQSLEALSTLLIPNSNSASQSTATNPIESPENS